MRNAIQTRATTLAKIIGLALFGVLMMGAGAAAFHNRPEAVENYDDIATIWGCAHRNGRVTNFRWNTPPKCPFNSINVEIIANPVDYRD